MVTANTNCHLCTHWPHLSKLYKVSLVFWDRPDRSHSSRLPLEILGIGYVCNPPLSLPRSLFLIGWHYDRARVYHKRVCDVFVSTLLLIVSCLSRIQEPLDYFWISHKGNLSINCWISVPWREGGPRFPTQLSCWCHSGTLNFLLNFSLSLKLL